MNKSEEQFIKGDLLLKEYLAADRTLLSIDRTLLAYIRTALTLFVAGVSLIKFFDIFLVQAIGWLLIPAGILTFVIGLQRCIEMTNFIRKLAQKYGYKVESATNQIPQPFPDLKIGFKETFIKVFRSFLPVAHHTEDKV